MGRALGLFGPPTYYELSGHTFCVGFEFAMSLTQEVAFEKGFVYKCIPFMIVEKST